MITFKEIDRSNYSQVIALKLADGQEDYVCSCIKSLADCWLLRNEDDVHPRAVYCNEELVGFILMRYKAESDTLFLWRLLIDESKQLKGLGKKVIQAVIDLAKSEPYIKRISSDYVLGNDVMKHLLVQAGFREVEFVEKYQEMAVVLGLYA